jgi:serine/threonine protein kinase
MLFQVNVAVKLYAPEELLHHINAEYTALQRAALARCKYICKLHQLGVGLDRCTLQPALVMEPGDMPLTEFLITYSGLASSVEFCMDLFLQMLLMLYELDKLQLLHLDVKPGNMVIKFTLGRSSQAALIAADLSMKQAKTAAAVNPTAAAAATTVNPAKAAADFSPSLVATIGSFRVWLVDFGFTKELRPGTSSSIPLSLAFTPGFGAPDLDFQGPNQPPPPMASEHSKLDVWSMGCTFAYVLTGKFFSFVSTSKQYRSTTCSPWRHLLASWQLCSLGSALCILISQHNQTQIEHLPSFARKYARPQPSSLT